MNEHIEPSPDEREEGTNDSMNNLERRRGRDHMTGIVGLSDYHGSLHVHTREGKKQPTTLEEAEKNAEGSNCAQIPLELLIWDHMRLLREYVGITNHSRDAGGPVSRQRIYDRLVGVAREEYSHTPEPIPYDVIATMADRITYYGNERILRSLEHIDSIESLYPAIKILRGVEVSLLPDGELDTALVAEGRFDLVNVSVHPNAEVDSRYAELLENPEAYSDLIVRGIQNGKTNIMCHIGQHLPREKVEAMRWEQFAEEAVKHQVALEINFAYLFEYIYNEVIKKNLDYREIADTLDNKIVEQLYIVSSPVIRDKLRQYITRGLTFAINTDEHQNPYIEYGADKTGYRDITYQLRGVTFWRIMKHIEKRLNEYFADLGVQRQNIINTFNFQTLQTFLRKE